jgi:hypothetical protein
MNKCRTICLRVTVVITVLAVGIIYEVHEHRSFLRAASRSIGNDLIQGTNSPHLVRISQDFQAHLSELLTARTRVADVLLGDEPSPIGGGTACSRVVLTNDVGKDLLIRLRVADKHGGFLVVGFRSISE